MKYRIVNIITGETVNPVEFVQDLIERDKLFRLPLLFSGEFSDLQIVSSDDQAATIARLTKALQEIDDILSGSLPVTRQVKQIAREALESK